MCFIIEWTVVQSEL